MIFPLFTGLAILMVSIWIFNLLQRSTGSGKAPARRKRPHIDVDPVRREATGFGGSKVTTAHQPILFYDQDKPYYEFTNFSPHAIRYEKLDYPTAEHLFQAHKFLPKHPELAERIRCLQSSRAALQEATRLTRLRRTDWFEVNIGIMDQVLEAKFTQHHGLRRMLLETGDREIVEASPVDAFWGTGEDGKGRNELGKALMRLRDKLRGQECDTDHSETLPVIVTECCS